VPQQGPFIDGEKGILRYRGYPIEQLAEKSSFLEVAWLLIYGELPTKPELEAFSDEIVHHTLLHENFARFFNAFPKEAHPMSVCAAAVAAWRPSIRSREDDRARP
jgi:citrate synthase